MTSYIVLRTFGHMTKTRQKLYVFIGVFVPAGGGGGLKYEKRWGCLLSHLGV